MERSKLFQRAAVDAAFEEHDLARRMPVIDPLPVIELRLLARIDLHVVFTAEQPQQEPSLFLSDTGGAGPASDVSPGEAVTKPVAGLADKLDMGRRQAELFPELPIQGVHGRLMRLDAALRELPGVLADAARPEHSTRVVVEDNPHVGPESVCVDHRVSRTIPPGG